MMKDLAEFPGSARAPGRELQGFIVALPGEARAVAGRGWIRRQGRTFKRRLQDGHEQLWLQCGVGPERAAEGARWLLDQGAESLCLFGVSGGLDPRLESGDLVVAEAVCDENGNRYPTTVAEWAANRNGVHLGSILTLHAPVLGPKEKQQAFRRFGALAVDMESVAVARAALEAGRPCRILRAICDPARRTLAKDAFALIDGRGRLRVGTLLVSLMRRPRLLADLFSMQQDFSRALKALGRVAPTIIEGIRDSGPEKARTNDNV